VIERNRIDVSICVDCYFYAHYGAESLNEVGPELQRDIVDAFDRLGDIIIGDDHRDGCGIVVNYAQSEDCTCSEGYFSWAPCDICDSRLGGNRQDVTIIEVGKE
jgi:hypothetical protein